MPEIRLRFALLLPHVFPHGNACVVRMHQVLKGSIEGTVCEEFPPWNQGYNAKIRCLLVLLRSDGLLLEQADIRSAMRSRRRTMPATFTSLIMSDQIDTFTAQDKADGSQVLDLQGRCAHRGWSRGRVCLFTFVQNLSGSALIFKRRALPSFDNLRYFLKFPDAINCIHFFFGFLEASFSQGKFRHLNHPANSVMPIAGSTLITPPHKSAM